MEKLCRSKLYSVDAPNKARLLILAKIFPNRKVGILHIQGDQFDIEPVVLKTVRPFKIDEVILSDEAEDPANGIKMQQRDTITNFLRVKVGGHKIADLVKLRMLIMNV